VSCGPRRDAFGSRLRLAWSADPVSLDPARAVDVVGGSVVALLYEGLVTFDADGHLAPGVAARWESSGEGRTWRFFLDPTAQDSEGHPIGAPEVVASFRRLLLPSTASPRSWVLERVRGAREFRDGRADSIAGLSAVDGAIVVELESPSTSFPSLLAMPNAAILPAGGDASGRVSTGPWVLVEHVRDSHLLLRRNPHWHGARAAFEEIQVRILPEEFTRVAEFEVGNLDVLEVPASESARFRADARFAPASAPPGAARGGVRGVEQRGPRAARPARAQGAEPRGERRPPLGARARRAGRAGVGRDSARSSRRRKGRGVRFRPGRGAPAARRVQGSLGLGPSCGGAGPHRLASAGSDQADLAAVGVKAVLRVRDWSALKTSIDHGETPAFFANWYADYPDPENFLAPLFHSRNIGGGGTARASTMPAIDSALDALERETDPAARAERSAAIDRSVHEACPWIYLWHPASEVCVSERLEGYRPSTVPAAQRWLDVRLVLEAKRS
jgi:peptide/nickel transport system substrate-binding protein/oligopeptide transport system substrate-binding protein